MFSSRFRRTLRKREAVLTRKFFFLFFHALNSSRFRSALRKRERNVSPFYVFFTIRKGAFAMLYGYEKENLVIMLTEILFFICQTWQKCVLISTMLSMIFFCSCFKLRTHAVILIHDLGSTKFWHVFFPLTRKFFSSFSCTKFVPFPECSPETGEKCITFLRF